MARASLGRDISERTPAGPLDAGVSITLGPAACPPANAWTRVEVAELVEQACDLALLRAMTSGNGAVQGAFWSALEDLNIHPNVFQSRNRGPGDRIARARALVWWYMRCIWPRCTGLTPSYPEIAQVTWGSTAHSSPMAGVRRIRREIEDAQRREKL